MRLLEAKETKFSVWIKSSLRLSWISYIGRIHKTIGIDNVTEWKWHLVSILNQIHLKIGQEEEKNRDLSNLSRKLGIWDGCLQAWIWKFKDWWINLKLCEHVIHILYLFLYNWHEDWCRRKSVLSWIMLASAL